MIKRFLHKTIHVRGVLATEMDIFKNEPNKL